MKNKILIIATFLLTLVACSPIRVHTDYDDDVDFSKYKTFAFDKKSVDSLQISDLDKKRMMRAIDKQLYLKNIKISESPNLLVCLHTQESKTLSYFPMDTGFGWGLGWGMSPFGWGMNTMVSTSTQGVMYIQIVDANTNNLIWEGKGTGYLTDNHSKKEEKMNQFAEKILADFPPNQAVITK